MLQLIMLCLWVLPVIQAGSRWELVKEGQGIRVYTASTGSAGFKTIKAEALLAGTPEKFLTIIRDIGRQPTWVYGTRQASLLKQVSDQELLYYVETELPWPAANRDAVLRMRILENKATQALTVTTVGEPRALPPREGKVRVPHFSSTWEVQKEGAAQIKVTYLLELHPGGSLPAGIVNLFISKGPYETFRQLASLLKK